MIDKKLEPKDVDPGMFQRLVHDVDTLKRTAKTSSKRWWEVTKMALQVIIPAAIGAIAAFIAKGGV